MFGIGRRSHAVVVPAVAAFVVLAAPRLARAGGQDDAVQNANVNGNLTSTTVVGQESVRVTDPALQSAAVQDWNDSSVVLERIWEEDFAPETDRWTDRNNRIKLSFYGAGLFFGGNLRIRNDIGFGLRLAWEVPGFIGVRLDSELVPWSHMTVRVPHKGNNDDPRAMRGIVDCTSLSVAIFNPELSAAPNLALWAGMGVDLWYYDYAERGYAPAQSYRWKSTFGSDWVFNANPGFNLFFDLQYKITDIFHVGFGIREHIVYAPQTARGEFYQVNGHSQGFPHDRNQSLPAPLSAVHEFNITVSVLF